MGESDSQRSYQRGSHIYPRKLASGAVVFYGYIPREGQPPLRVSLETSNATEADIRLRQKLAELESTGAAADVRAAATQGLTLAEISLQFLAAPHGWTRQTERTQRARVYAVGGWFEDRGIIYANQITPQLVDEWMTERRAKTTHRTINRDLRAWRVMLAWAHERKLCDRCDAVLDRAGLREARRQRRHIVPSPDEMRAILAKLAELWKAKEAAARARMSKKEGGRWPREGARECIAAVYVTGLRIDELRRLRPEELRPDGSLYMRPEAGPATTAEPGKGYRERSIPLALDAQAIMAEFFAVTRGKRYAFSESWLVRELHSATDALGIPRCGLHDLRRAFATEMVRNGVEIVVVSRWLGHADIRTTELYLAEYRSDARVVAPVPRGVRVQTVSKPTEEPREIPLNSEPPDGAAGEAKEAGFTGSYPSDLNRRPAVYETELLSRHDNGNKLDLHTRAKRGDALVLDALARWEFDELFGRGARGLN